MIRDLSLGEFRALCCVVSLLSIRKNFTGVLFQKRHPQMLADSGRHSARKSSFSRMSRRVALPEPTSFDFSGRSNSNSYLLGKSVFADEILGCCSCRVDSQLLGQSSRPLNCTALVQSGLLDRF